MPLKGRYNIMEAGRESAWRGIKIFIPARVKNFVACNGVFDCFGKFLAKQGKTTGVGFYPCGVFH